MINKKDKEEALISKIAENHRSIIVDPPQEGHRNIDYQLVTLKEQILKRDLGCGIQCWFYADDSMDMASNEDLDNYVEWIWFGGDNCGTADENGTKVLKQIYYIDETNTPIREKDPNYYITYSELEKYKKLENTKENEHFLKNKILEFINKHKAVDLYDY